MRRIPFLFAALLAAGLGLAQTSTINIPLKVTVTPTGTTVTIAAQTSTVAMPAQTCPPPQPASTAKSMTCPAGTAGSWTQTTTYACSGTVWKATPSPASAPAGSCTPVVTPPAAGLHVSGNRIVNAAGTPMAFRGVNRAGTEYQCVLTTGSVIDGPADVNSVAAIKNWGANLVRVPLNESCWLGINGVNTGGAAYQSQVAAYVNLLTSSGLAVVLDLHWAAPGTTKAVQQLAMPNADHSAAFWTQVAGAYKSNLSVIFDLYNEPFPDSNQDTQAAWTCLRDGGTCPGISYQAVGMQALVTAIRGAGAQNVIMVPGVQYTNTLTQWAQYKPVDPLNNLAASWHSYNFNICITQACWTQQIGPVAAQVPLIAGEIGENDCAAGYVTPLMTYLDSANANYVAWAWNAGQNCSSFPSLITDYTGTPTGFGAGVKAHLLALAGGTPPVVTPPAAGVSWVYHNGAKQGVFDMDVSFAGSANYSDTVGNPGGLDIAFTGSQYNGGWQLMSSRCQSSQASCLDTTQFKYLILQIKPTVTGQKFQIGFMSAGDTPDGPVIDISAYGPQAVAGTWGAFKIPLSAFGLTNTSILKFWLQGNTQGATKWYINEVGYSP